MIDDDMLDGEGDGVAPDAPPKVQPEALPAEKEAQSVETPINNELLCLSCGAGTVGIFCTNCGQKNDDLRRSSFVLVRDFFRDTFGFDSRMWRTLGFLAVAPGIVASNYSAGKRSRYTPPVRLFLVVSFLFFLILSLTNTLIIAMAVTPSDVVDENKEVTVGSLEELATETSNDINVVFSAQLNDDAEPFSLTSSEFDCQLSVQAKFFVRPKDLPEFGDLWERCANSIEERIAQGIEQQYQETDVVSKEDLQEQEEALGFMHRVIAGTTSAIENPASFNRAANTWLPRLMILMTPVLALILALFLRGKDALLFDHMVFGLYLHVAMFAIVGSSVLLGQLGVPQMGVVASLSIAVYYIIGLKRAYGRGWVKTIWTSLASGFLYVFILLFALLGILTNILWTSV